MWQWGIMGEISIVKTWVANRKKKLGKAAQQTKQKKTKWAWVIYCAEVRGSTETFYPEFGLCVAGLIAVGTPFGCP